MPYFSYIVTVNCATEDQALQVMQERIHVDEDYGFEYGVNFDFHDQQPDPPQMAPATVLTLAAIELATREGISADQAAMRVVQQRHEVQHAIQRWRPPRDSYRAQDLDR